VLDPGEHVEALDLVALHGLGLEVAVAGLAAAAGDEAAAFLAAGDGGVRDGAVGVEDRPGVERGAVDQALQGDGQAGRVVALLAVKVILPGLTICRGTSTASSRSPSS
jgi:hypothetical protein